jgi:hypothetical protein
MGGGIPLIFQGRCVLLQQPVIRAPAIESIQRFVDPVSFEPLPQSLVDVLDSRKRAATFGSGFSQALDTSGGDRRDCLHPGSSW